jgi:hypothetical protein
VAEGGGLLNRYTLSRRIEGSNPSVSAKYRRLPHKLAGYLFSYQKDRFFQAAALRVGVIVRPARQSNQRICAAHPAKRILI